MQTRARAPSFVSFAISNTERTACSESTQPRTDTALQSGREQRAAGQIDRPLLEGLQRLPPPWGKYDAMLIVQWRQWDRLANRLAERGLPSSHYNSLRRA